MRITWIIGNGFDCNMGLRTGYRQFLDEVYLSPGSINPLRDELVNKVGRPRFDGAPDLWSDLESLLGAAAPYYEDDVDGYVETFEDLQKQFIGFVLKRQEEASVAIDEDRLAEFRESLSCMYRRMTPSDVAWLGFSDECYENVTIDLLLLNYTGVCDAFWGAVVDQSGIMGLRGSGFNERAVYAGSYIHLHGRIDDKGVPDDIVFGVSDSAQIESEKLACDEDICELWVKSNKNEALYGNDKTRRMRELLSWSGIICIYGSSLGASDNYIWNVVGQSLLQATDRRLIIFWYGLPDRHGLSASKYQRERNKAKESFLSVSGLDAQDREKIKDQIVVVQSDLVFRTGSFH